MAQVIWHAWQNGAKFDAWSEQLNIAAWYKAFEEAGLAPEFYAHRERGLDEVLPWDHISSGLRKSFLLQDYKWSKEGKTRPDCREQCYYCGILPTFETLREGDPSAQWRCP